MSEGFSTKYPREGCALPFLWFSPEEEDHIPNQVYPNWRKRQRLPLPPDAHQEHARHDRVDFGPPALTDWRFIQFLRSVKPDELKLALLMHQGYGGDEIIAEMVFLKPVTITCDAYRANIHVNYYRAYVRPGFRLPTPADVDAKFITYHWSALVLAVAPLKENTPFCEPQIISESEKWKDPKEWTFFMDFVAEHGIPKEKKLAI